MSDPINANPTVLELSDLPRRASDDSFTQKGLKDSLVAFQDPVFALSLFAPDLGSHATVDEDAAVPGLTSDSDSGDESEPIDAQEIYDLISTISDPEHPLTLGQLAVVNLPHITVVDSGNRDEMAEVKVEITPTITHCSLATLIGLGIRVRLERCLPPRYRITILVREGTHQSENQVNKQLNDKERIAAACENEQLLGVISNMLSTCV